jgi:hypothetical protein
VVVRVTRAFHMAAPATPGPEPLKLWKLLIVVIISSFLFRVYFLSDTSFSVLPPWKELFIPSDLQMVWIIHCPKVPFCNAAFKS